MPKFLEKALEAQAAKKGFSGRRADRYVYGAMNNLGAMKGNKETPKGARMQAKHERDYSQKRSRSDSHIVKSHLHPYHRGKGR